MKNIRVVEYGMFGLSVALLSACGASATKDTDGSWEGSGGFHAAGSSSGDRAGSGSTAAGGSTIHNPLANPSSGPPAGNPHETCSLALPADAAPEDVSEPDHVIGDGTQASCSSQAVVDAVAQGGVITFNCGPDPIVIRMTETAKIVNNTGPKIVIDGGGKVTLSGDGSRRILYMNTCDAAQGFTTSHCQDQDHPQLSIQNLTFADGNAKSQEDGGGAIFARGG